MSSGKYWTDAWNFCIGCEPCSAVCDKCWAQTQAARWAAKESRLEYVTEDGQWTGKTTFLSERLELPQRWGKPRVVAVNWLGDLFYSKVTGYVRKATLHIMKKRQQHQFLVLTKRPERMMEFAVEHSDLINAFPDNMERDEDSDPQEAV